MNYRYIYNQPYYRQYNMPVEMLIPIVVVALIIIAAWGIFVYQKSILKKRNTIPLQEIQSILEQEVLFYNKLCEASQIIFAGRILTFIQKIKITGIKKAKVDNTIKVLVGASAIIPIFNFPDWEYKNLEEVLIYPASFNKNFDVTGHKRNIIGLVGEGPMNGMMILSQQALLNGFRQHTANNTGIHEFIHLIDKSDGSVDGIPEVLIPKMLIRPWMHAIYETTQSIINDESPIRKYAATNEAEFLAVTSEYFFQNPDLLQAENPELFTLLSQIYRT